MPHWSALRRLPPALAALVLVLSFLGTAAARQKPTQGSSLVPVWALRPPVLDGTLRDPLWETGALVDNFHQREPFEGATPGNRTTVRILYDHHALYFGVHCWVTDPASIVARELRRDGDPDVDDHFTVVLSPTDDGRSGYKFIVNPLGTQFDSSITDEGRRSDPNWDGIWTSNAHIGKAGWTATLAIPFSTLNFKAAAVVSMGVNFLRFTRADNEQDLWRAYLQIEGINRLSEAGHLSRMQKVGSGRLLVIKPYILGGLRRNAAIGTRLLHTGGLDVKYGLGGSTIANLTLNTDFADAEVDPQQLNLTPFRRALPEKRQFFLENSGTFAFYPGESGVGNSLFFSRQIGIDPNSGEQVPLQVGAKVTGTAHGVDFGVLEARTGRGRVSPAANFLVGRAKRKLFAESYVGAMVVDKQSQNPLDPYNRVAGVDGRLVFFKKLFVDGAFARSYSSAAALRGRDTALAGSVRYDNRLVHGHASRSAVAAHFNPEAGFVDRTDLVANEVGFDLTPRPVSGPVRQYDFEGFLRYEPNTAGTLQTQEWQATFRAEFNNGAYTDDDLIDNFIQRLNSPFKLFKNVVIAPGLYHFQRHQLTYGTDRSKRLVLQFFERFGSYYSGSLGDSKVRATFHPGPRVALSASETWDHFRFGAARYNVNVGSYGGSYSFNRLLTTNLLLQLNSIQKNPVSMNLRVRYNYRPDSDLYVIYNIGSQFNSLAAGNPVLFREQRLTTKFTYSF